MQPAPPSTSPARRSRLAFLVACCLVAVACGSTTEQTLPEFDPLAAAAADPDLASSDLPKDIEYGASLSEFVAADDRDTDDEVEVWTPPAGYDEIEWDDLIPPGSSGAEISAQFDERIAAAEPGSAEAEEIYAELQEEFNNQPINPEVAGDNITLAGFVAPLTYADDLVTEFLLVPYFGACIHVPPPPANQTIIVTLEDGQGLPLEDAWGAVWVAGTVDIDGAETDLATAGYSITGAQVGVYEY